MFPILMVYFARVMDVVERYAQYIVIRNWVRLLCYVVLFIPTGAAYNLGILGIESVFLIVFLPSIIQIWVYWRVARDALQITGVQAMSLVVIDFVSLLILGSMFRAIVYGGA